MVPCFLGQSQKVQDAHKPYFDLPKRLCPEKADVLALERLAACFLAAREP